jgi:hypothetical protein
MLKIEDRNGKIAVIISAPLGFLPAFNTWAKNQGARWDKSLPGWGGFDTRDTERVRERCLRHFGTDGTPCDMCDITGYKPAENPDYFCGRLVAERAGRDQSVALGRGVVVLSGGFPGSGGSVKNPRLDAKEGTRIEIRDVPLALAREFCEDSSMIVNVRTVSKPPEVPEAPPSEPHHRRRGLPVEPAKITRAWLIPLQGEPFEIEAPYGPDGQADFAQAGCIARQDTVHTAGNRVFIYRHAHPERHDVLVFAEVKILFWPGDLPGDPGKH